LAAEQWPEQTREEFDKPGLFRDAQKAQPQRQGAEQHDHHFYGQLGHGEQAFHQRGEHCRVATDQPAPEGGNRGDQKKAQPEAVEHVVLPSKAGRDDSGARAHGSSADQ